jgi:hypothetical protein
MTQKEAFKEIKKCKESPYYFATKYLTVEDKITGRSHPFTTFLTEDEFNYFIETWNKK